MFSIRSIRGLNDIRVAPTEPLAPAKLTAIKALRDQSNLFAHSRYGDAVAELAKAGLLPGEENGRFVHIDSNLYLKQGVLRPSLVIKDSLPSPTSRLTETVYRAPNLADWQRLHESALTPSMVLHRLQSLAGPVDSFTDG